MFEIPDEDGFWDEFSLEEEGTNISPRNKTSNDSEAVRNSVTNIGEITENKLGLDKEKPDALKSPDSRTSDVLIQSRRSSERKFPGPAGLLPSMASLEHLSSTSSAIELVGTTPGSLPKEKDNQEADHFLSSQSQTENVCSLPQWRRMEEDLGNDAQTLLNKFSIKTLLLRASRKMLSKGKTPLVFGVMETLDVQGADAGFVIRDQTGKMKGSLHKDLIQDPSTALQTGCVLILRQVSVISPSSRTHYLNVTPGNVVFVYTPTKQSSVTKRPWLSPPVTNPELPVKDFEMLPSLQEIIIESQRELSESLKNFHNQRSNWLSSGSSHGSRGKSQTLGSLSLFSTSVPQTNTHVNNTRFQARPVALGVNRQPFGGISGPHSSSRLPNTGLSECPIPSRNSPTSSCFKQPFSGVTNARLRGPAGAGSEESRGYMISGGVAVRQKAKDQTHHAARGAGNWAHNPSSSSHFQLTSVGDEGCESSDFDFDFPGDNEDSELLKLCDETLSNSENICEETSSNQFRLNHSLASTNSPKQTNNVIFNIFKNCEDENRMTNSDPHNNSSHFSGKTFTFKRRSPSSCADDAKSNLSSNKKQCLKSGGPNESKSIGYARTSMHQDASVSSDLGIDSVAYSGRVVEGVANDRQRDSRVQLGQGSVQSDPPVPHLDAIAQWNDDLTDDLLLSQLSEEF
ncbi:hypothetical protein EGW08_006775 [Elysia chlorotica]|uniref:Homologous recombination OB-fold protein OB-fold domain-containing protein n=1 Tax=Elysia chlorotica TaxID=188477 RepID=A0A433TV71_ELYCH|nr:hypothetical protein EGW08_006775 [Elysia chlorotica]